MSQKLLQDARLWQVLVRVDDDLAASAKAEGCRCGGELHSARFPRKPRGLPAAERGRHCRRASFCCADDGCRKRTTPPSVIFLGRRVFVGAVVVLATAMRHGLTWKRTAKLRSLLSVSVRTLQRWRAWWREVFPATATWRDQRARFTPPVAEASLPGSLVERFGGGRSVDRFAALLQLLAPLSVPA